MTNLEDSFTGCLVGLAVGDALGMPVEGLSCEERNKLFGYLTNHQDAPASRNKILRKGQYTDDTQLTLAIVDSLLESPTISFEDMARRFAEMYKNGALRRAGRATQLACKKLNMGNSWEESGTKNAEGCGPATRIAPLALIAHYSGMKDISDLIDHSTKITHESLIARQGAAVAFNCVYSIVGKPDYFKKTTIDEFIQKLAEATARMTPEGLSDTRFYEHLMLVKEMLNKEPAEALARIGTSGRALETVPAALYCFFHSPYDFEKALITAVNAGGDTDSIGAITGAIAGAFNGINAIPGRWVVHLENYDIIRDKAQRLYTLFAAAHS